MRRSSAKCNQAANTFSILVNSFSEFALFETESVWVFEGTAEGGTVEFTIDGVMLVVVTTEGETAVDVAANIAAAINVDLTLSGLGITATAEGDTVTTNGSVTSSEINDPGLSHWPMVPAFSPWGRAGLSMALLAAGVLAARARLWSRPPAAT